MLPTAKDYRRVKHRIETALERPGLTSDEPIETILDASADLLGITGSCWHHTDPGSGIPIASAMLGAPAGTLEWSLDYEFHRPDINRFEELALRRSPLGAISAETGGEMSRSARFHEMIQPSGSADELRVAFVDQFGFWTALAVFTDRRVTAEDLRFMDAVVPAVTAALRRSAVDTMLPGAGPDDEHEGPSVLILNRDDRIVSADVAARRRLAMLPEPRPVELPGLISFVSAQARWASGGRASTARMRTVDGRWFLVDASRLDGGDVAVVMQPAPPATVLDGALRAMGLTAREREVAALALRGQSAKAIASTLVISPWTAQDHLKAIYDKTGVRSRAELLGLEKTSPRAPDAT